MHNATPLLEQPISHAPASRAVRPDTGPGKGAAVRRWDRTGKLAPLLRSLEWESGWTIDPRTGEHFSGPGFLVAYGAAQCKPLTLSHAEMFGRYADDDSRVTAFALWLARTVPGWVHTDLVNGAALLGAWHDEAAGTYVIEPVQLFGPLDHERAAAVMAARARGEKAIYDNGFKETIYV